MQQRFTKARMKLVLETRARQCQKNWRVIYGSELNTGTPYHEAELHGPHAIRLHERYNSAWAMYHFIDQWDKQSEAFLDPDHVGVD